MIMMMMMVMTTKEQTNASKQATKDKGEISTLKTGTVHRFHSPSLPPCLVRHILDHVMNDVGYVSPSRRWACILMRSRFLD